MRGFVFPLVLVLWLTHSQTSQFWFPTVGTLTADSGYRLFYVGENLTLHCHKQTPFNGTVKFKRANDAIDAKYVTRVNDTYARLSKLVTAEDKAEAVYHCSDISSINQLTIYTDYRPENATHFGMVYLNKKDLMMSWTYGADNITYKNSHTTKVILTSAQYRVDSGVWHNCTESSITTCQKTSFADWVANVSVRVNITNVKRQESVVTILPGLIANQHAKPLPIPVDSVTGQSSRSAVLTVKHDLDKLRYRVHFCPAPHIHTYNNACVVTEFPLSVNKTLTVTGLKPSYTYSVSVQAGFDRGYFSDFSSPREVTLPEDAPDMAPEVTPGSFYLDQSNCNFYIYMQDVVSEHQNGQIVNYTGEVITATRRISMLTIVAASDNAWSRTLKATVVDCGLDFNVSVSASTEVGPSPSNVFSVAPWDKELYNSVTQMHLRLRVSTEGSITAEWIHDPSMDRFTLLLYYCFPDPYNLKKCRGAIQHQKVENPEVGRLSLEASANMMFGMVAISLEGSTTGIVWSNCIYNPKESMGEVVRDVTTIPQEDKLVVSWGGPARCDSKTRVIILGYEVMVCFLPHNTDCTSYKVDGDKTNVHVRAAEGNRIYSIRVRANTTSGQSNFTQPLSARPLMSNSAKLTGGEVTGIILGILTVLILVGVLIACYCRDKLRRAARPFSQHIRKLSIEPPVTGVDLDVDTNTNTENDGNDNNGTGSTIPPIQQQVTIDSGCNQDSPPLSPSCVNGDPEGSQPDTLPGAVKPQPPKGAVKPQSPMAAVRGVGGLLDSGDVQGDHEEDNSSQEEEGGRVLPYVKAARVPDTESDTAVLPLLDHLVYNVTALFPPPALAGSHARPAGKEEEAGSAPSCGLQEGGLQTSGMEDTVCGSVNPSAVEDFVQLSVSKGISSYVRLSTAGPECPVVSEDDADRQSACGDGEEEGVPSDLCPLTTCDVKLSYHAGLHSTLPPSPPASTEDDAHPNMTGERLTSASAEQTYTSEPLQQPQTQTGQEAESRMKSSYVHCPGQWQSTARMPEDGRDVAQDGEGCEVGTGLVSEAAQCLKPPMTLPPAGRHQQSEQGEEAVSASSEAKEETACAGLGQVRIHSNYVEQPSVIPGHVQGKGQPSVIPGYVQVKEEPSVIPGDGYVSHPSLPSTESSPVKHGSSSASFSMDSEERDADSDYGIHPECMADITFGQFPTGTEDTFLKTGYVHIGDDLSEKAGIEDNQEPRGQEGKVNSNGYVPWQTLPFNSGSNNSSSSNKNNNRLSLNCENHPDEGEKPPGFYRLDSGYVSPLP